MFRSRDISHHTWQAYASTLQHLEFSNSESKHCDDGERFSFYRDIWHRHRKGSRCNQNSKRSLCCPLRNCCRSGMKDYHRPELKCRPIDWDGKMWEGHRTNLLQEFGSKSSKPDIWLLFVAVFLHGVRVCRDTVDRMSVSMAASWDCWLFLNTAGTQLPFSDFWTALEHPYFQMFVPYLGGALESSLKRNVTRYAKTKTFQFPGNMARFFLRISRFEVNICISKYLLYLTTKPRLQ